MLDLTTCQLRARIHELDREAGNLAQLLVAREDAMRIAHRLLAVDEELTDDERREFAAHTLAAGLRNGVAL